MSRLGKLKRQAIQEANKRNLLERAEIIGADDTKYIVYAKKGDIALSTDNFDRTYKMEKTGSN